MIGGALLVDTLRSLARQHNERYDRDVTCKVTCWVEEEGRRQPAALEVTHHTLPNGVIFHVDDPIDDALALFHDLAQQDKGFLSIVRGLFT